MQREHTFLPISREFITGSFAEQHESGDWLRARQHCSDRFRRRAGVDRFRLALGPGTRAQDLAMPALTFVMRAITLCTGRTYMMQGAVHLVLLGCCS